MLSEDLYFVNSKVVLDRGYYIKLCDKNLCLQHFRYVNLGGFHFAHSEFWSELELLELRRDFSPQKLDFFPKINYEIQTDRIIESLANFPPKTVFAFDNSNNKIYNEILLATNLKNNLLPDLSVTSSAYLHYTANLSCVRYSDFHWTKLRSKPFQFDLCLYQHAILDKELLSSFPF